MFVHLMGHTGNYTREEAVAAIDQHGILPDMLNFDPSQPAQYPNGRVFTDDAMHYRLDFLTKGALVSGVFWACSVTYLVSVTTTI